MSQLGVIVGLHGGDRAAVEQYVLECLMERIKGERGRSATNLERDRLGTLHRVRCDVRHEPHVIVHWHHVLG